MALTFPLSAAAFADLLQVESVKFNLQWQQEMSGKGGDLLTADLADAYWEADVTTVELPHADAHQVMASINALGGGVRTFYLYNPALSYPQADMDGSTYGASTPVVGTVADSFNLSITGLPADYVITKGDFLQITYGTRTYFGQFAESATASGAGVLSSIAVAPALPAGVASADAVNLIKPSALFKMVTNTAYLSTTRATFSRITFSARQTHETP